MIGLKSGTDRRGRCRVVSLTGDLEHATVPSWRAQLEATDPGDDLVVDLAGVRYVDSAGIGLFLWLRRRALDAGGRVLLARPPHFLDRILQIAGLPALVPCYADLTEALEAVAGDG